MSEEIKKYRLPREITEKWLVALRSGEYDQGQGKLKIVRDEETSKLFSKPKVTYCCLGVLGMICGIEDKYLIGKNDFNASIILYNGVEAFDNASEFIKTYGVPVELTASSDLVQKLIGLNDTDGYSFKVIADWIENNVELY